MSFVEDEGTQSTMLQPPPAGTPVVSQQVKQKVGSQRVQPPATPAVNQEVQPKTATRRVQPAPADGERQPSVGSVDQGTRSCSTATTRPDTSLKEKFWYNVWSKYWLEAVVGLGAVGVSILIVLVTCFVALPQLKPNCTVKSTNGDWSEWTRCKCGDSFAFTTRQYSSKDDSPPFCNNKTQTRRCPRRPCCDGFGQTFNGSSWCFGFDGRHMSWGQARQEAASDDVGSLASIHSDQEIHFIQELWENESTLNKFTGFWIGFRCFRAGYCEWADGSQYDFVLGHWETFANSSKDELCAYMDFKSNGSKFTDCDRRLPFVKRSVNMFDIANCSSEVKWCYVVHNKAEWSKAHEMAIISSAKELMFIKAFTGVRGTSQSFWLGLQCSGDLDQSCVWKDGTPMTFSNWSANAQPLDDTFCVVMNSDGGWDPRDCREKYEYITETEPHCDKIGQHYWSPWSECKCLGLAGEKRHRHRGTKVNGTSHTPLCPHYVAHETQEEKCNEKQCDKCSKDESFPYCYEISKIPKSYMEVRNNNLVVIESEPENDYIMKLLKPEQFTVLTQMVLIGLVCEHNQQLDYCMWSSTGERLTLNKFGPGQPRVINDDHKCVAIHVQSELWVSVDCNTEYNYIEEHRPACDKFINYTHVRRKPISECNKTSGLREFGQKDDRLNCPLVEQVELRSCYRNCTANYEKELEFCYKVVKSRASFTSLTLEEWDHKSPVLAVMLDDKHARFINQRVVPAAFKNKAEPLWLGFTCWGTTQCFWEYNEGEFDPTELPIKSQIDIKRKDHNCGLLDWKLDSNNSALEVAGCNEQLEYVLEMAPGCDKFHRFSSIEYKCDQPQCGPAFCFPNDTEKNCPHYANFAGSCCMGETEDDIFGCYSVVQLGEGVKGMDLLWLAADIPNLGDPFSETTVRLWKNLIKFNTGIYLTSVRCSDDFNSCGLRSSEKLPTRMNLFLKQAVKVNATGGSTGRCNGTQRCYVLYNSYTENLELLDDVSVSVTGYITQYAKYNDTEKEITLLRCRPENTEGPRDVFCPVNGRCCHGKTAAHVYACYDVVIAPKVTYEQCKASNPNLADMGRNSGTDDDFITAATVQLFQQIIQNDTGRYWTNLKCDVDVPPGYAICTNHYSPDVPVDSYRWPSITHKCNFRQDCCALVYDSSLRGLNTQDCSSTENINGYILQRPKYVPENGRLNVSKCYHDPNGGFSSLEQSSKESDKYCPTKGDEECIDDYKQTLY